MVACKRVGEYKRNQEKIKKFCLEETKQKKIQERSAPINVDNTKWTLEKKKKNGNKKPEMPTIDKKGTNNTKERNHLGEKGSFTQTNKDPKKVPWRGLQGRFETSSPPEQFPI